MVLVPVIYLGWIVTIFSYPSRDFTPEKWAEQKERRYEFSKDLIESKILLGRSRSEIIQLLGKEGNDDQKDIWSYYLGFTPGLGVDPDMLQIVFREGNVIEVRQIH